LTRGRVHWYTKGTGHGFIKPDDGGPMAFVRREDLAAGEEENLKDNDEVSFEVVQGTEGPEARNVSRV
jgi:cold shock protein